MISESFQIIFQRSKGLWCYCTATWVMVKNQEASNYLETHKRKPKKGSVSSKRRLACVSNSQGKKTQIPIVAEATTANKTHSLKLKLQCNSISLFKSTGLFWKRCLQSMMVIIISIAIWRSSRSHYFQLRTQFKIRKIWHS